MSAYLQSYDGQQHCHNFPPVYFLDFEVFKHGRMEIPKSIIPLEPYTKDRFQRARLVAERYFTLAHPWLPIISKRLFYDLISNPLKPPHADTVLLLSCMDLVTWLPSDSPTETSPKSLSYAAAKRSLLEDEIIGAFTIQHLHAMILVALYELGHGIYPAAYMSIGACVRYGVALGIHPRNASGLNEPSSTLLEQEERRRAWWAMLILDRWVLFLKYLEYYARWVESG